MVYAPIKVHFGTFFHEKTRFFNTPKEIEYISSATRHYTTAYELKTNEDYFLKTVKEQKWKIKVITNAPFKIIRYNFVKYQDYYTCVMNGKPDNETSDSCYHYIYNGYYYIDENNHFYRHVAYDRDQKIFYLYEYRRGKGPLSQKQMNPEFYR
jgi:hypothetical protein